MFTFYIIGVVITFLFFLVIGSYGLYKEEKDFGISDLLFMLLILSWLSWIIISIVLLMIVFKAREEALSDN